MIPQTPSGPIIASSSSLQALRDRALLSSVRELLAAHATLARLPLDIEVRGGVAHVRGVVPGEASRRLVRRVLSRHRGIHAVWDTLVTGPEERLRIIDIGCGGKKQVPWATGVDCHPFEGVDVVTDLERRLPFDDGEIDHVFAVHLLEHIRDLLGLMNEVHRVLKPNGVLHLMTPLAGSVNAVADPTHVRFFNRQSFKFFCRRYPNLRPYRPGAVSTDADTVYADLYPVGTGEPLPSDEELAYFFD